MSVFGNIRNDRGIPLTFVERAGDSAKRGGGIAEFLETILGGGGLSSRSPVDVLREGIDPEGLSKRPGAAFKAADIATRIPGAGVEAFSEFLESGGEALSNIGSNTAEHTRPIREWLFGPSGPDGENVPAGQQQDLFNAVRERNEIIGEGINVKEALDEYEREQGDKLSREDRERLDMMREEMARNVQLAEAEESALLREQFQSGQLGRRMQEELFGDEPLIPGASPEDIQILNRALGRSQFGEGVSQNELLSIMDQILESNLSADEKEERLDFIQTRTNMRDELQLTVNNVIEDRLGIERMASMTDLELLGNEAEFQNTMLNFELGPDPQLQTRIGITNMIDEGFEELTGKEIPPSVAPMIENGEDGLVDDLIANPDLINTPGFQQRVADVAAVLGVKHSDLLGMIQEGSEYGNLRVELWDNALNQTQFTPQSEEFAMAIFQAALPILGDAAMAAKFAESQDLHMIVAGQSGGMVGRDIGDGNKHGIGGLTDEAYASIGIDYEDIRGDTAEEIAALVRYITEQYGTPVEAINAYKRTGIWGD